MRHTSLRSRMLALAGLVVACFLGLFAWTFHQHVQGLYAEKRLATRHAVEAAHAVIAHYAAATGGANALTEAEAKTRALASIKSMRYGEGDYFWVNDVHPKMVMHPTRPELDGKDLTNNADPNGKRLFVEMVEVCRREGAGFVDYMWAKPGHDAPQPKISYVKLAREWGWIVGSGIYVDDVRRQVASELLWFGGVLAGVMVLVGGLTWWAIEGVVRPLRQAVGTFRSGAAQIASASEEVASTAQQLSQGASSQAASIEEISASMEEVGSITRANTDRASRVAALMNAVDEKVGVSHTLLGEMGTAMAAIESSSRQVSKIIKTIDEIAFQTNILALNAAVEAARAGEAGMGFAVVADEVRALAQRAAQAARDTSTLIEQSLEDARAGTVKADLVVSSISGFTGSVSEARTLAAEVDDASRQQQQGLEAVAGNIAQLERVTQATAAAAEESAAASEQLHAHSELSLGAVADLATVVGERAKPVVAPKRARPAGPALQLQPGRRVTSRAA